MLETNHSIYTNTEESKCNKGFSSGVLCCQQQILIKELAELWFLDIKNIMRPSSYAIYQSYANKYILPYIGNIQADMFNADILSSLLGSYCKGNGKGGGCYHSIQCIFWRAWYVPCSIMV